MVGGVDLRRGPDLGAVADRDFDDVEDDAVEIEEDAVAETDVVAIVAVEGRTDHGVLCRRWPKCSQSSACRSEAGAASAAL